MASFDQLAALLLKVVDERDALLRELHETAASKGTRREPLHVKVVRFSHGYVAGCECLLCHMLQGFYRANKVGRECELMLRLVPGPTTWSEETGDRDADAS